MADLPRPVTMMISVQPAATASSTPYWIRGLSTRQSISFGIALVAGRKRVPRPAAGNTALRILWGVLFCVMDSLDAVSLLKILAGRCESLDSTVGERRMTDCGSSRKTRIKDRTIFDPRFSV